MKLTALFSFIFLLAGLTGEAQSRIEIKAGSQKTNPVSWDIGVTNGILFVKRAENSYTIGGDLRIQKKISEKWSWLLSGGYTQFDGFYPNNGIVNIKAGAKIFMSPKFYVAGELGFGEYIEGGELLIYTPSIGIQAGKKWDLNLKWESYSDLRSPFSQIGLRVGYKISK